MKGSFIAVLLEVVTPHLNLHCHFSHRLYFQAISASVSKQHVLWLLQLIDVAHQKGAARCNVGWRNHIKNLHLPRMTSRRRRKMEVPISSDHRSPKEILTMDNQGNLRPSCWILDLKGHLKGKVPNKILLILRGELADPRALSVRDLPSFT